MDFVIIFIFLIYIFSSSFIIIFMKEFINDIYVRVLVFVVAAAAVTVVIVINNEINRKTYK